MKKHSLILAILAAMVYMPFGITTASAGQGYHESGPYNTYSGSLNLGGACSATLSKRYNDTRIVQEDCNCDPVTGACDTCDVKEYKVAPNICTDSQWRSNKICYLESKLHDVEWVLGCPMGKITQTPPSIHYTVRAKYAGHGTDYDPAYPKYDNESQYDPKLDLACRAVGSASNDATLMAEKNADFGSPNMANRSRFSYMGCEEHFPEGQWTKARGGRATGGPNYGSIPCLGASAMHASEATRFECKPNTCNMDTGVGCDILEGYYDVYIDVCNLKPAIGNPLPNPTDCVPPAFVDTDPRYCGDTGCTNANGDCTQNPSQSYYTGISRDTTPVPPQQFYLSAVTVEGIRQPIFLPNAGGTAQENVNSILLNDFKSGGGPKPYFSDEVPARNGVFTVEGGNCVTVYAGRTPLQVRSYACPMRPDGYTPLQNITLGQKKWISVDPFVEDSIMKQNPSPDAKVALGEQDSCKMVEDLAKEIPTYNIFPEGQDGAAMALAVSTAVNQLLDNPKKGMIPVLTLAATEPVKDCAQKGPKNSSGSFFKNMAVKWGAHDNYGKSGTEPGKLTDKGRWEEAKCLDDTLTSSYPKALADASKRLKDQGGYVIAIALSCSSADFRDAMMGMSTAKVNLKNFAPEGVFLDNGCKAAMGENGKIDPTKLASSLYFVDTDEDDTPIFRPAFAQSAPDPLFGTVNDVFAELAWIIVRDQVGAEICANQDEGYCDENAGP